MVTINGTSIDVSGKTLSEYLAETSYEPKHIVVERNGKIVSRARYDQTILEDNDVIEVVSFVGGG